MKIENLVRKLQKSGYRIYEWPFQNEQHMFVNGTALVDLVDGIPEVTTATYKDVIQQIEGNRSHIRTLQGKTKELTSNLKMGG